MTELIKIGFRKYIMIIDADNQNFIDRLMEEWRKNYPKIKLIIIPKTY